MLRAVANAAGNVVVGVGRRREQGGGRQRREDRVEAYPLARRPRSQGPPTPSPPHHPGMTLASAHTLSHKILSREKYLN